MTEHPNIDTRNATPVVPPPAVAAVQADDRVSLKTWLAVIGSAVGAFLAVLNIQVVNSSLADIQGAIGAGIDTGGWISTSYLIAEIIVIPLAGWFTQALSLRRYLIASAALFLVFSVACASAHSLTEMIIYRAAQGFFGGVLIPLAFTIVITMLPKSRQPIGLALFAFSATFAPAIGPTIGGWLNDTLSWHFIFYVNLVPGAIMLALLWVSLEKKPMQLHLLKDGDWPGIATIAIGLGTLQTVLEEGNRNDWFGSSFILWLSVTAVVSLALFLWIELRSERPLVNLRLLADRNFGLGTLSVMLLGFLLYGTVFVVPLYLSQTQGYNAMQIGTVLAWTGLPQLVIIPFVPWLMKRIDLKFLLAFGFTMFAASNFMNMHLTGDVGADQLLLPNIVRALGQSVLLAPLTAVATAGIAPKDAASASAIYNMMRNLGGAFGIAALQTYITKREQFHSNILTQSVSVFEPATQQRLEHAKAYLLANGVTDPGAAWHGAVMAIGRTIRGEAYIMAYGDAFILFGVVGLMAVALVLMLNRVKGGASAGAH